MGYVKMKPNANCVDSVNFSFVWNNFCAQPWSPKMCSQIPIHANRVIAIGPLPEPMLTNHQWGHVAFSSKAISHLI